MPLRTTFDGELADVPFPSPSPAQLAAILARHDLGVGLRDVAVLPTIGMVNTVVTLGDRYILRLPKPVEEAFDDAYTESVAVPTARAAGVRTPTLVAFDDSGDILDVPYTLYERVQGTTFGLATLEPAATREVYRQLGRDLALLHRNVADCPDPHDYLDEPERVEDPAALLDGLGIRGLLNAENVRWLTAVFANLQPAIDDAADFRRFLHDDAQPTNVMVDHNGVYAALLDWGDAGWGDPALDFTYTPSRHVPDVLAGYREIGPLDGDDTAEQRILWDHLGAALEYLTEPPVPGMVAWDQPPFARFTELLAAAATYEPWRKLLAI